MFLRVAHMWCVFVPGVGPACPLGACAGEQVTGGDPRPNLRAWRMPWRGVQVLSRWLSRDRSLAHLGAV